MVFERGNQMWSHNYNRRDQMSYHSFTWNLAQKQRNAIFIFRSYKSFQYQFFFLSKPIRPRCLCEHRLTTWKRVLDFHITNEKGNNIVRESLQSPKDTSRLLISCYVQKTKMSCHVHRTLPRIIPNRARNTQNMFDSNLNQPVRM